MIISIIFIYWKRKEKNYQLIYICQDIETDITVAAESHSSCGV